jgi:hypothetical protein
MFIITKNSMWLKVLAKVFSEGFIDVLTIVRYTILQIICALYMVKHRCVYIPTHHKVFVMVMIMVIVITMVMVSSKGMMLMLYLRAPLCLFQLLALV